MIIKFEYGKEFIYSGAYCIEQDFCHKDRITRPSIEIQIPLGQTTYNEIESIISDPELIKSFTLIGNMPAPIPVYKEELVLVPSIDEKGNIILSKEGEPIMIEMVQSILDEQGNPVVDHYEQPEPVMHIHENYKPEGRRITIEDDIITFKLYQKNADEIENDELKKAIDILLIAMEM